MSTVRVLAECLCGAKMTRYGDKIGHNDGKCPYDGGKGADAWGGHSYIGVKRSNSKKNGESSNCKESGTKGTRIVSECICDAKMMLNGTMIGYNEGKCLYDGGKGADCYGAHLYKHIS